MKRLLMLLCALTLIFGMAGGASAVPFGISSSSLSVSWDWGGGFVSYSPNSLDPPVDLGVGGFHDFTFGEISIPLAVGEGTATLSVDFFTPTPDPDSGVSGTGSFFVLGFWIFTLGEIDFDGPTIFEYSYMGALGGLASVEFDDIKGIKAGHTVALTGTIRHLASPDLAAAPVPEPATILLMGTGLLGLVAYSRKRFSKKS